MKPTIPLLVQATSSGKQQDLKRQLRRLVLAADAHVADLYNSGKGQARVCGLGPPARCPFSPFLVGRVPLLK